MRLRFMAVLKHLRKQRDEDSQQHDHESAGGADLAPGPDRRFLAVDLAVFEIVDLLLGGGVFGLRP